MGEEYGDVRVVREGRLCGQALEQQAAERIDVGAPVDRVAGDLLGGDVVDRSHQLAVLGQGCLLVEALGEAEVRQIGVVPSAVAGAGIEQHVGGLHVPVDEPASMGGVEGAGNLRQQLDRVLGVERALAQALLEVRALDIAHGDEKQAVGLAGLVDGDDVRVVDRGCELGLFEKPLAEGLVLGKARSQELQRHLSLQPQILGQVDDAHASSAEQGLDPVAGKLGPKPGVGYGHSSLPDGWKTIRRAVVSVYPHGNRGAPRPHGAPPVIWLERIAASGAGSEVDRIAGRPDLVERGHERVLAREREVR